MKKVRPVAETPHDPHKRNRLSRKIIVEAALHLLSETTPDRFTLAPLAKSLNATTMSLYTYFESREALLSAVAEHVFSLLEESPPTERWQDQIYNWLSTLKRHLDRYPAAIELMAYEDNPITPAWFKTLMPVVELLNKQGLAGPRLAFVMDWFQSTALGLVHAQLGASGRRERFSMVEVGTFDPGVRRLATDLYLDYYNVDSEALIDFGFRWIVTGLEQLIAETAEPPPRTTPGPQTR
jgi:AcrR family transcriptional regulator